jgi:hypothetical protein
VLAAGTLFTALGGDYVRVGSLCSLVYGLGMVAIWAAPSGQVARAARAASRS